MLCRFHSHGPAPTPSGPASPPVFSGYRKQLGVLFQPLKAGAGVSWSGFTDWWRSEELSLCGGGGQQERVSSEHSSWHLSVGVGVGCDAATPHSKSGTGGPLVPASGPHGTHCGAYSSLGLQASLGGSCGCTGTLAPALGLGPHLG